MRGRIVAEIIFHQGVRYGNLLSAVPRISGCFYERNPLARQGQSVFLVKPCKIQIIFQKFNKAYLFLLHYIPYKIIQTFLFKTTSSSWIRRAVYWQVSINIWKESATFVSSCLECFFRYLPKAIGNLCHNTISRHKLEQYVFRCPHSRHTISDISVSISGLPALNNYAWGHLSQLHYFRIFNAVHAT